jgi:hypothetical protein
MQTMARPPVFKVLFVASEVGAMGLSFAPDDFGQGAVVSGMEAPVEARRLHVALDPKGPGFLVSVSQQAAAEAEYDAVDVGDVLVQVDSESVWNTPHQQVRSLLHDNAGRAHVLYFVDQVGALIACPRDQPRRQFESPSVLFIFLFVCLSVCLAGWMAGCLSGCLAGWLSCLFVCLSVAVCLAVFACSGMSPRLAIRSPVWQGLCAASKLKRSQDPWPNSNHINSSAFCVA